MRDHTNRICRVAAIGGNKVRGGLAGSLIAKMAGSIRERLAGRHTKDPLAHGEGLGLSTELPDRELGPCEGLQRGLGERLSASRYFGKNNRVVDGSLHLYLIFTFCIYIATLVVCFTSVA